MINKDLHNLHKWLSSISKHYICMILDGSIATGDKLLRGRSDKDVILIFKRINKEEINKLERYLSTSNFDDAYMFIPFTKSFFIKKYNNTHDFSRKFRSNLIYGKDITKDFKLPSKKQTVKIYKDGLMQVRRRLSSRIINSGFWSVNKVKDVFWKLFKHAFMYLAIKIYSDSDKYPKTREEVVKYYKSPELDYTLETLNNIDKIKKKRIIEIANSLNKYLEKLG